MENLPSTQVNFDSDMKVAQMLVKSGYVPKDVSRPEQVLFLMLLGRDMGLSPVQSLRHVRMIQGRPELSADIQLGKFCEQGGKFKWLKLSDTEAHLWLQSPSSLEPHVSTFSIEHAKRAGLLSNATWGKYPKAMLRSRAITQGLKDIGFILGAGIYAPGEVGGGAIVDENTGEVLPGEFVEDTPAQKMIAADIQPTAGAVEALSDAVRESVTLTAQLIQEAIANANTSGALNLYMSLDNADEKVAVKRLLSKTDKRAIVVAYDELCRREGMANTPKDEPVVLGAEPDINDVRAHIRNADMDLAADVARSLSDPVLRKAAEEEVLLAGALKRNKVLA